MRVIKIQRNNKSKPQRAKRRSPARYALRHPAEKQAKSERGRSTKTTTDISPGHLSSWKDNCIFQIHQIKAIATSVMTTKCIQRELKGSYIIHQLSPCKKETTKTQNQPKQTETPKKLFSVQRLHGFRQVVQHVQVHAV